MGNIIRSPRDFIFRALREHKGFMPISLLSEKLRISEQQTEEFILQLAELQMVVLHPVWPIKKEVILA